MSHLFQVYPVNDITITKARGSYVWDKEGLRYLDLYGGHAVISIGHAHPHWVKRIEAQLRQIPFYSNSVKIPVQEELAEILCRISGKKNFRLFLCNSGAEANENALKLASFHNERKQIVAFQNSFHGRTSLALAVTDNPSIRSLANDMENVTFLPFNDEHALEAHFRLRATHISSVIVEGIQGVGGIRVATASFLRKIRSLCDAYGAVFIADGVQCGFGRSGKFFSHDHAGIEADIYTMAKGMGNGFPVGGILIDPKIKAKPGILGSTFGGSHLACTAALAVLEVIEQEGLMDQASQKGAYLLGQLGKIPRLQDVRGRGLMTGFDLPATFSGLKKRLLFENRVFTGEARPNVIRLLPALTISRNQIDDFINALTTAIENMEGKAK